MKRIIPLSEVKPGEKLGKDVFTERGKLLVAHGTVLSQRIIEHLLREGLSSIYIEKETDEKPVSTDTGLVKIEPQVSVPNNLSRELEEMKRNLGKSRYIAEEVSQGRAIPLDVAYDIVNEVCEKIQSNVNLYSGLMSLRTKDNYSYEHSLGVCIISSTLARTITMTKEEMEAVSLSALLHDIGKTGIDEQILKKPGPLSEDEWEIIKQHPVMGYKIVKDDLDNNHIAMGVLQHHEREDGSGYPLRLVNGAIHQFAKIISISDTFDAITSDRYYKKKQSPIKALQEIFNDSNKFDKGVCTLFLRQFSQYYVGAKVTLNTGHEGHIVQMDIDNPAYPIVRIDDNNIDLRKLQGIFITG